MNELVGGNQIFKVISDDKPCAVAVRQNDDASFFGKFCEKLRFFVGGKNAETVRRDDIGPHDRGKLDFVVFSLDNDRFGYRKHRRPPALSAPQCFRRVDFDD